MTSKIDMEKIDQVVELAAKTFHAVNMAVEFVHGLISTLECRETGAQGMRAVCIFSSTTYKP